MRRFQYNPLLSVFLDDCQKNKKDVSWGGARYHDVGITSVAMGNLVNALLNIKELVFERRRRHLGSDNCTSFIASMNRYVRSLQR